MAGNAIFPRHGMTPKLPVVGGETDLWLEPTRCLRSEIRYCGISKEMSSLYIGLVVFCLFEAGVPEFDTQPFPRPVQLHCTLWVCAILLRLYMYFYGAS